MRHVVGHDGEGDGTALAERRHGVDAARQPLLAYLQEYGAAHMDAVAVRVAYLALCLEVPEVADDGELLSGADGAAYLIIYIGQCGAARRAYLGIVQGAALLAQPFLEDAILQLLHAQVGLLHLLLVGILLAQLAELELCRAQGSLSLPHTVARAGAEAVEIKLVPELCLQLRDLHLLHLNLHLPVRELRLGIRPELRHLLAAYLALVEGLGVVRLGRLQVQS